MELKIYGGEFKKSKNRLIKDSFQKKLVEVRRKCGDRWSPSLSTSIPGDQMCDYFNVHYHLETDHYACRGDKCIVAYCAESMMYGCMNFRTKLLNNHERRGYEK